MARIELKGLAHSYRPDPQTPADYALQPFDMSWRDGGAYALLGPSGCGKTTLLNIISGLIVPSHGQVLFDGVDVTHRSPQERNIAQVFQFPVIYDTMTVAQNLAFPLKNRGVGPERIRRRVGQVAEMLELSHALDRRASGLSADAKQKISLGRGLVREDVSAVLFDEPLTVIDPHLKWQLRRKLKQIHNELKLTLIYVTHDQVEALTFADEVVVMSAGRVVQLGTAEQLFTDPAHVFVGHFIGSPGMNFLPMTLIDGVPVVAGDTFAGSVPETLRQWIARHHDAVMAPFAPAQRNGEPPTPMTATGVLLGIRPEHVRLVDEAGPGTVRGTVERVQYVGTSTLVTVRVGTQSLKVRAPGKVNPEGSVLLSIANEHTRLYRNLELAA